ncbi:unnamed protein product [Fusarium equiseti]|uniref:Apple domain-containing protein n=1 Tax=Fusarium equiseti TaxID=61235 RepID=A0A8J2NCH1_FUSEQ|nr:unnamed protein product [Fusarium equiseti]
MSRHLVRSFLLAMALSPFVNAGPCRPHPTFALSRSESLTQTVSSSLVSSSSVVLIGTETVSQSDAVSQDAATGTGTSTVSTDTTLTFSDIYSVSTATTGDAGLSTDLYPNLPSDSTFTISTTTYGAGTLSTMVFMSSTTDPLPTIGTETTISHATDTTTVTASETVPSSAMSSDTTVTSGETGIASTAETESVLSVATDTTSSGRETQSSRTALDDTTAASSGTDISSAIETETSHSVGTDTTLTTSGTESSLASSTDTTATSSETDTTATTTGDASSATTSGTSTDTTVTPIESETTTTTSGDLGTTGTDSSASTIENVSADTTTTAGSTETTATTVTGAFSATTATSKETDTTTTTSGDLTTGSDSFTSSIDTVSTDTTATTATTSGDSTTGTEGSSTTEATSSDTTVTTKETDTTTMTSGELTTTTTTDSFTSTTEATSDTTLSSSETGTLTTVTDSATSTTETGSTDSTTTDTATTETTATSSETTTTTSGDLTTTETTTLSSTTQPEPTCTNNLKSPAPANKVCGKNGIGAWALAGIGAPDSLEACAKSCKSNNECTSFNFEANSVCFLYSGALEERNNLPTTWMLYELDCLCDLDKPDAEPEPEVTPKPEPEPQCVNNILQPSPKDSVCGKTGNPTGQGREEIGSATATSLQGCRDACNKKAGCDSFQLEEGFNCYLFKGKVGGTDARTTSEVWYDMSCFCGLEAQPNNPDDEEEVCVDEVHKTQVCGLEGRPMYECIEDISENTIDPALTKSLDACKAHCKTVGCDSLAFKKDEACAFFKGRIGGAEPRSDFPGIKMYDMSCFDEGPKTEEPTKEVCIGKPLNPLPANTVCGKPGDVNNNLLSNKRIKTDMTLAECYQACNAASDCDVFNFNNQRCELYKTKSGFSVCVDNMLAPAPQGLACGKTGIPIGSSSAYKVGQGTANTPLVCYQLCKNMAKYQTVYFHKDTGDCQLYSGAVKDTNSATTCFVWYDKGCFCELKYVIGD